VPSFLREYFLGPVNSLAARAPAVPAKFHLDRLSSVSLRPKTLTIWNFTNIIAPRGRPLARFLQNL